MRPQLSFYPDVNYRTKKVMFELTERPYSSQVGLHLIYGNEHIPDFYLIDFDDEGLFLERAIGIYIGNETLDLDVDNGRIMKVTGVDDI